MPKKDVLIFAVRVDALHMEHRDEIAVRDAIATKGGPIQDVTATDVMAVMAVMDAPIHIVTTVGATIGGAMMETVRVPKGTGPN